MRAIRVLLMLVVACAAALALAIPLWAHATRLTAPASTFIVDTTGDLPDLVPGNGFCEAVANTPSCTLRAAIMEANARPGDDLITFSPAIVTPAVFLLTRSNPTPDQDATFGDLDLTGVNGALTIAGGGPLGIIIDASNLSPRERVFDVQPGAQVTLTGLTVRGGQTADGGGISNQGTLLLDDVIVRENQGTSGGGGIFNFSTLTLRNSSVLSNTAPGGFGGGIDQNSGQMTIIKSTIAENESFDGGGIMVFAPLVAVGTVISGNHGSFGGGLYLSGGTSRLTETVVSANQAISNGGGIYLANASDMALSGSTVSDNHAGFDGAGIFSARDVRMTASTLARNIAGGSGGGFYLAGAGTNAQLVNSTLSSNRAAGDGGGFAAVSGTVWFTYTTIVLNLADSNFDGSGLGGGVYQTAGTVFLHATILANNSIRTGIVTAAPNDCDGTLISNGSNLIETPGSCTISGNTASNLTGDPALNPLGMNGGPTATHLPKTDSKVIDGATNLFCPPADQRGAKRPIDGNHNGIATCDIGAVEYLPPLLLPLVVR